MTPPATTGSNTGPGDAPGSLPHWVRRQSTRQAVGSTVVIPAASSAEHLRGYLAVPSTGTGPWPCVLVLHEVFGLTDDVRSQADRLARSGYLALAPDLYTAGGPRCLKATFSAMTSGRGAAFGDIEAARQFLLEDERGNGSVGVIGFCMGGGFALLTAASGFDAASVNYGQLPTEPETVLAGACPIIASYGSRDRRLAGSTQRLTSILTDAGVPHDVKEYPDAGHSFMNTKKNRAWSTIARISGLGYHHDAAEDAWDRILTFFATHLQPRPTTHEELTP